MTKPSLNVTDQQDFIFGSPKEEAKLDKMHTDMTKSIEEGLKRQLKKPCHLKLTTLRKKTAKKPDTTL